MYGRQGGGLATFPNPSPNTTTVTPKFVQGKREVADLTATIEQDTASIASLTSKVEDLAGSIAANEADVKAATAIRAKEAADWVLEFDRQPVTSPTPGSNKMPR